MRNKLGYNDFDEDNTSLKKLGARLVVGFIIFIILLMVFFGLFYTVHAGQRGILLTFGKPNPMAMEPGLHLKMPMVQSVVIMNVQTQKFIVTKASSASQDLQEVTTEIAVNYHINPSDVVPIYTNIGKDYENVVIAPAVSEVLKATTAKYSAEELITNRAQVKDDIDVALSERLRTSNVIVDAISITDFQFSDVFTQAIENKVTAQQNALAAQNKLEQVKYEAQQAITQAEGQAQAQALLAKSVTAQTIEYQRLQIELAAINKWNGVLPQVTGGAITFINLNNSTTM